MLMDVFAPVNENIARDPAVTNVGSTDAKVSPKRANALSGTSTVAWLSEFSLFWQRSHDTMLVADSYSHVLHVSRQAFLGLVRQFPVLQDVIAEAKAKKARRGNRPRTYATDRHWNYARQSTDDADDACDYPGT